jgi:hypothetical protein
MPDITNYRIDYNSSTNVGWKVDIRCYSQSDDLAPETAYIRFWPEGATMPADGYVHGSHPRVPQLNFPISQFGNVLGILKAYPSPSIDTGSYDIVGEQISGWGIYTGMATVDARN